MRYFATIHAMNDEAVEKHKREAATDPVDAVVVKLEAALMAAERIADVMRDSLGPTDAATQFYEGRRTALAYALSIAYNRRAS